MGKNIKTFESWLDMFKGTKIPMNRVSNDIKDKRGEELQEYLLEANDDEIFDDIINNINEVEVMGKNSGFVYKGISFYFDRFLDNTIFYIYSVPEHSSDWYRRYITSDEYYIDLRNLINKKGDFLNPE